MNRSPFLARDFEVPTGNAHTRDYLAKIGVPDIAPATCPFDPGFDPLTFEGHLMQSSHLMEIHEDLHGLLAGLQRAGDPVEGGGV